jgi:mono/diheme cytochrome c family protein/rhodanese-related sulfurtransferase
MKRAIPLAIVLAAPFVAECQSANDARIEHGRDLYGRMCVVCHGLDGEGYVADRAPAIGHQEFLAAATDDFLVRAIERGRTGTTMSAWGKSRGGPLTAADQRAMVAFMRTWQKVPPVALDERPLAGNAAGGAAIYERECAICHGDKGMNGWFEGVTNPELLAAASNGFLRYSIAHGRSETAMSGYRTMLGPSGVDDVVAVLRSWQQPVPDAGVPPPPTLGNVVLNPNGPAPVGFLTFPAYTSADVIKGQLDQGARFGILDARAPSDYSVEHIAGAVSVPFYDPEPAIPHLPKDTWLVSYCACPHAESGALAQKLLDSGFSKVSVLDEGFFVWKSRGYPTRTGSSP